MIENLGGHVVPRQGQPTAHVYFLSLLKGLETIPGYLSTGDTAVLPSELLQSQNIVIVYL